MYSSLYSWYVGSNLHPHFKVLFLRWKTACRILSTFQFSSSSLCYWVNVSNCWCFENIKHLIIHKHWFQTFYLCWCYLLSCVLLYPMWLYDEYVLVWVCGNKRRVSEQDVWEYKECVNCWEWEEIFWIICVEFNVPHLLVAGKKKPYIQRHQLTNAWVYTDDVKKHHHLIFHPILQDLSFFSCVMWIKYIVKINRS